MRIGRTICLFLILILGSALPLSQAMAAEEYIYESNWAVTVDFVNNRPNATLLVEVWQYEADSLTLFAQMSSSHVLECKSSDSVSFKDNVASFSGDDGIYCELPDMQLIVEQMTNGDYKLPEACSCKTGAIVQTTAELAPNSSKQNWQNPVATLNSIAFAAPIPAKSGLRTRLQMMVDGETAVSPYISAPPNFQFYEGSFDEINPYPSPFYQYFNSFQAGTQFLGATPAFIFQPLSISNVEPVLHIGFDPATGEGFHGRMSQLFVDPGCFGGGGY